MLILTPSRKLIRPPARSFRSLDEAMCLCRPEESHNIDLTMTLEVKDGNGFSQGRETLPCHSFVKQFMQLLQMAMKENRPTIKDWCNNNRTVYGDYVIGRVPDYNFNCNAAVNWCWHGPVCGTGSTAAAIDDYKMEEQITHGTRAADASITTGTGTGKYYYDPSYYLVKNAAGWTTNAYANCFLEFTSGDATGIEVPIYSNDATTLTCFDGSTTMSMRAFPSVDPGATPNFTIKTYGMLAHGSVAFTAPTDNGALQSKFQITRDFTNNQGGNFTINEVGLYLNGNTYSATFGVVGICFLAARDALVSPVELSNGQILTLTYNIITNA